ncbi:MAG: DsbA family oxidoreductase [Pseudomonadota bacterium]
MTVSLTILSDPICPWCYIGKTRLNRAIKVAGVNPFEVTWRPFQLNPDMPPEGVDRQAYLEAKFGKERAEEFYAQIEDTALSEGLKVDFSAIERTPNTVDAHRVIRWSFEVGVQSVLMDELFDRFFRRGEDISEHSVLVEAAQAAGMDGDAIARLLAGDTEREAVLAEDAQAREIGVQAVPTFIVANRHVVQGAQPHDLWVRVINDIQAQEAGAEPVQAP